MDYNKILNEINLETQSLFGEGKVANYIPALSNIDPKQFAMSLQLFDGTTYHIGDTDTKFSIQSISKVFSFTLALHHYGKDLYKNIGCEPSGNSFNSLVQLEYENGVPRNPFINAGAIVITDLLINKFKRKTFDNILDFIHKITNDTNITCNENVLASEKQCAFKNIALINMIKSYGNISNDTNTVIDTYLKHCSIQMSTKQLSRAMLFFANAGKDPLTHQRFITPSQTKRINAVMLTCGHYDASGDFAYKVGLPGKSGVGGGIVAVVPGVMSICVWSPQLNEKGNSLIGTKALELFTTKTGLSIF